METVVKKHAYQVMHSLVQDFDLVDENGNVLKEVRKNRQAKVNIDFDAAITTSSLHLRIKDEKKAYPAAVFGIHISSQ